MLEIDKRRFFSQYYGQKVMYVGGVGLVEVGRGGWNWKHPDFFLELKSISDLSEEDAIKVSELWGSEVHSKILGNIIAIRIETKSGSEVRNSIGVIDYLRSKGYALPYMGYSVNDLIELGWVKIKKS